MLGLEYATKKKVLFDLGYLSSQRDFYWEPMAGKRWERRIIPDNLIEKYESIRVVTKDSSNLSQYSKDLFKLINISKVKPYWRLPVYNLKQHMNSSIHANKISTYSNMASLFLSEFDRTSELWRYWDRDSIEKKVFDTDYSFRSDGLDIEVMGLFLASACWFTGLDQWRGVTNE